MRLLQLLDNVPIAQVTAENKRSLFLGPPALQAQRMKELVGWWTPELQCTAMPRQIRATIAQISDLHINRKVDPSVITMLKHLLQKITPSPDILIVSGDLANQPVPWQMKKAAELVHDIEKLCKPKCTIVIPGNHDFKFWGNVGLRRLTRIPFEIYFRRNGLERTFFWRVKQAFKLGLNALWWKGRHMREPVLMYLFPGPPAGRDGVPADNPKLPELGIAVFTINSNTLGEMMAAGKVESRDLQDLYAKLDNAQKTSGFEFLFTIAVVHHHPAPIADAPYDAIARIQDTFTLLSGR